jgi:hypothetical protein
MMFTDNRRTAIAQLARVEQRTARMLQDHTINPTLLATAELVEQRLAEIVDVFLRDGSSYSEGLHERLLSTAERWLEFYVSELRRLEDLVDAPRDVQHWTRH